MCENHRKQLYCLYCKTCKRLVCPECIVVTHSMHNFDNLENTLRENIGLLSCVASDIQNNIINAYIQHEHTLDENIMDVQKEYDMLMKRISRQEEKIKILIEEESNKLRNNLTNERNRVVELITEERVHYYEKRIKLKLFKDKIENKILIENDLKDVIDTVNEFESMNKFHPKYIAHKEMMIDYKEGHITTQTINNLLGFTSPKKLDIRFSLLQSHPTDLSSIITIVTLAPNIAWFVDNISNTQSKMLQKIEIGENIRHIDEHVVSLSDIDVSPSGELFAAFTVEGCIKRLTSSGKFEMFYDCSPLILRGLHITKSGYLLIGVRECGIAFPITDRSSRQILIINNDKKLKKTLEFDPFGKRLFSVPLQITTNNNGDICVVDAVSMTEGRVIAVRELVEMIKWEYLGHKSVNSRKFPFNPDGIVCTKTGNIIVCEKETHTLHILSEFGAFIHCQNLKTSFGIRWPCSLTIDSTDLLWIGCSTAAIEPRNAKFHILKFNRI